MAHVQQASLPKVFVTGDLNIDNVATGLALGKITQVAYHPPTVGGSAYNAAIAFKRAGFRPVVFGKVGNDVSGELILSALKQAEIPLFVERDEAKPTCVCNIIYFQNEAHPRTIYYWSNNANDYDTAALGPALQSANLSEDDLIFS